MSSESVEALRGIELTRDEIDRLPVEEGVGLLSLADDGVAYAVPISFGYDGEDRPYFFAIRFGEKSRKAEFMERTDTATFVVYTVSSPTKWRSVLVTGEVGTVPESDHDAMEEVMYDDALAARLFPYDEPVTEVRRAELRGESVSDRKGMGYEG